MKRFCAMSLFAAVASSSASLGASAVHTPAAGTPERVAITKAMHHDDPNRVCIVRFLKVQDDWAWIRCDLQSKDGKNHYEPEQALVRRTKSGWGIVDQPCGEENCDEGKELARIRAANPAAPAAIFP